VCIFKLCNWSCKPWNIEVGTGFINVKNVLKFSVIMIVFKPRAMA